MMVEVAAWLSLRELWVQSEGMSVTRMSDHTSHRALAGAGPSDIADRQRGHRNIATAAQQATGGTKRFSRSRKRSESIDSCMPDACFTGIMWCWGIWGELGLDLGLQNIVLT